MVSQPGPSNGSGVAASRMADSAPHAAKGRRLLHFVPHYSTGGVELAAESGARNGGGILRTHYLSTPYEVKRAPCDWITAGPYRSSFGLGATVRALREVRRQNPDIIVFSLWRSFLAFLAVRLFFPRKPVIVFLHNTKNNHVVNALFTRIMVRFSDALWADSLATAVSSRAGGRPARPISMLLHRSDTEPPQPTASSFRPHFVSWCRLNPQKRVHLALELIWRLKKRRPDVHYYVIGQDDGCLPFLKAEVERLGLGETVEFLGRRDRAFIENAAREATFYLQLSAFEGQAMAVTEAMQLGLIPVVTPVGAIADYCEDGVNAIFYSEADGTAERLHQLFTEPDRLPELSAAARSRFSSTKQYAEDVLDAFEEALVAPSGLESR